MECGRAAALRRRVQGAPAGARVAHCNVGAGGEERVHDRDVAAGSSSDQRGAQRLHMPPPDAAALAARLACNLALRTLPGRTPSVGSNKS